jgi:ATP-dependent RNA helicase DDX46/PRP5
VAYTFISPDEGHLAEDILRVLELSNQPIPDELRQLVRSYKEKYESGEADKFKVNGYIGRGYEFSMKEKEKVKQTRKELGRAYMNESDEEELEIKGGKAEEGDEETNKQALVLRKQNDTKEEAERKKALSRNPVAKSIAIETGMNVARNAIIAGKTEEEAFRLAQEAIQDSLAGFKQSNSVVKGVEIASQIIEEWVEKENKKNNVFTCELDINDYPQNARINVSRKAYLNEINELSGCSVTLRGTFVEPGKKPPLGQKKLHLYIQGNSSSDVQSAYNEIKKNLNDAALQFYTRGSQGYTGGKGKYAI